MTINFDMDGTIADLYGVENWLAKLRASDPSPYAEARPLVNLSRLARLLNRLTAAGYNVNVISWLSKTGTPEYNEAVTTAKLDWLAKHLPSVHFTEIKIVPYGVPKQTLGNGILFDDEEPNRLAWGEGAHSETEIFQVLKSLL